MDLTSLDGIVAAFRNPDGVFAGAADGNRQSGATRVRRQEVGGGTKRVQNGLEKLRAGEEWVLRGVLFAGNWCWASCDTVPCTTYCGLEKETYWEAF